MTQITSIAFETLRNGEFRALHTEGLDFAKAIKEKDLQAVIAAYEKSVQDLSSLLEASFDESTASQVQKLDRERNTIYISCRKVAQASTNFPDQQAAETGARIWKVFKENPNPIKMNQALSTNVILNIVNGLKNIGEESLVACGFKIWLDKLEAVNSQFIATDETRITERSQKEQEQCKKLRAACVEAYNVLVSAATFKAATGSESCRQFLSAMNTAVIEKKQQVKSRKARKRSDDPSTDMAVSSASPTTVNDAKVGVNHAA